MLDCTCCLRKFKSSVIRSSKSLSSRVRRQSSVPDDELNTLMSAAATVDRPWLTSRGQTEETDLYGVPVYTLVRMARRQGLGMSDTLLNIERHAFQSRNFLPLFLCFIDFNSCFNQLSFSNFSLPSPNALNGLLRNQKCRKITTRDIFVSPRFLRVPK